jgi:hypothetical protein
MLQETSAAYRALTPSARRVLRVIERELGDGDQCEISRARFRQIDATASCSKGVAQLQALGFIASWFGDRRARVFERRDRWQGLTATEAAARVAAIRGKRRDGSHDRHAVASVLADGS